MGLQEYSDILKATRFAGTNMKIDKIECQRKYQKYRFFF